MESTIRDYKCTNNDNSNIFLEISSEGISFPDAYKYAESISELARAVKTKTNAPFVEIPFCHTLEAEALGAVINLGNEMAGPRAGDYIFKNMEEILVCKEINFSSGRIFEVLKAARLLSESGEAVLFSVSGPLTILDSLINPTKVYKCMKNNPKLAYDVFWKLGKEVLRYIGKAKEYGASLISYADSSGGVNILGPKMAKDVVEHFSYEYVKELCKLSDENTMVLLCPKTTFSLLDTQKACFKEIELDEVKKYGQACIDLIGKCKLSGMTCIKNFNFELKEKIFREIVLK